MFTANQSNLAIISAESPMTIAEPGILRSAGEALKIAEDTIHGDSVVIGADYWKELNASCFTSHLVKKMAVVVIIQLRATHSWKSLTVWRDNCGFVNEVTRRLLVSVISKFFVIGKGGITIFGQKKGLTCQKMLEETH